MSNIRTGAHTTLHKDVKQQLDAMKSKVFKEVLESCPPEAEEKAREYAKEILDKGAMKEPRELTRDLIDQMFPDKECEHGERHGARVAKDIADEYYQSLLSQKDQEIAALKKADLISALEEYQQLLIEEIESLVPLAHVRGWRSTRHEKGSELRERINKLKEKYV